jgi:hypothetical protein
MNQVLINTIKTDIISGLYQCTNDQKLIFKRMYSHNDITAPIGVIVNRMPVDRLKHALRQVERTLKDNSIKGANSMATATGYNPMKSKSSIQKEPDEIFRCKDVNGEYWLYKTYSYRRKSRLLRPDYEIVRCGLDIPAEYVIESKMPTNIYDRGRTLYSYKSNPDYELEMINYQLNKSNCNEYELRNLIMGYLKNKRKSIKTDMFKQVCSIFDKADKMLSRCDRRKNSNMYEADVSYKFLIKSYRKIVDMCEAKVKPKSASHQTATKQVQQQAQSAVNQWQSMANMVGNMQHSQTMSQVIAQYIKYGKIV